MPTILEQIPLDQLDFSPGNPRSDAAEDLDGLSASLGREDDSLLLNPPLVQPLPNGRYQVIAGERRVRAARLAGWQTILCQVRTGLDARAAQRLRVVENLHRRALQPLDQAAALKISWLAANAEQLGLAREVETVLSRGLSQPATLSALETLLQGAGFVPTHPPVSWNKVLDDLGVELKPDSRKKLLRVLALDPQAQETVRPLALTEAALRSIGTLEPDEQRQLAGELAENPELARKTRRIARIVRDGSHSLDEAIAEAKGQVSHEEEPAATDVSLPEDERASEQVIRLLEAATSARQALDELRALLGENYLQQLPEAWRAYAAEALALLQELARE